MIAPEPIPQELMTAIHACTHAVIIGHKSPDSDSLNSQLALASLLDQLGKSTQLVSAGPFTRHEIVHYEPLFDAHIAQDFKEHDPLIIIVDCSSADRIGYLADEIDSLTTMVIDHHSAGQGFGDITFIDPKAFSVTYMIMQLFEAFDVPLSDTDAHRLLFGLATDTGYFRHIGPYRGEVFTAVSRLVDSGASPRAIYQDMYGEQSFASRKLIGLLLYRMEEHFQGRLLLTWETFEETEHFGEVNRDTETLYAQMLSVRDCEVIVFVKQDAGNQSCIAGFRAHGESPIDVGAIAAEFGGGGHRKASGATIEYSMQETIARLIDRFSDVFDA
jgi:bifunctional oligoribonuclease and PAP phosphatase NrnA